MEQKIITTIGLIIAIILGVAFGIFKHQTAKDLKAEEQKKQAVMRENAQQLQKAQQEYIKDMAHRLKTPPNTSQPTQEPNSVNANE